jgi:hypothetical protein
MPLPCIAGPGSRLYVQEDDAGGGDIEWAPNLPSGLTTIVSRYWDPTDASIPGGVLPPASLTGTDSTGMQWYNGGSGPAPIIASPASLSSTIGVTIPALPDGHATVMAIKYPSGFSAGELPFGCFVNTVPLVKRLYLSCWVLMPSTFDSNGNNIKWVFYAQGDSRNHVLMLSSGDVGGYVGPWMALQGGGNGSTNVGGNNNTKSGAVTRLLTPSIAADDTWHCMEWLVEMESSLGSSGDGVFKSWIDGVLTNDFRNINFCTSGDDNGFNGCSLEPYYGGGGGAAPSIQYICVGRFFCAGGN